MVFMGAGKVSSRRAYCIASQWLACSVPGELVLTWGLTEDSHLDQSSLMNMVDAAELKRASFYPVRKNKVVHTYR